MDVPVNPFGFLKPLQEGDQLYSLTKNVFLEKMGPFATKTNIVSIQHNFFSSWSGHIRFQSHQILLETLQNKYGGNANYAWGWYGASKDDISAIFSHGFTRPDEAVSGRCHGVGIHLTSPDYLLEEVLNSAPDEEGIRYIFTCCAILGKSEVITDGSKQFKPSSADFDTGVDNHFAPQKYIVWSAYMNSHLLPSIIICFKCPDLNYYSRESLSLLVPNVLLRNRLSHMFPVLEFILGSPKFCWFSQQYELFKQGKIQRPQMMNAMMEIVGEEFLNLLG